MSHITKLAIRFADLWAVDHHQMVDEIYDPAIHMESMARLNDPAIQGRAQLHALEDRLAVRIPEHRHELVRVTADDRHACLETTVVGPTTGEYAPACVWWWPGDAGQIAWEVGWFDWELRSTDAHRSHGFVPRNDGRNRGDGGWYRAAAVRLLDAVADPGAPVGFASGCVIEHVGEGRADTFDALRLAPATQLEVTDVVGDGSVFAALLTAGTDDLISRGTVVFSLDAADLVCSVRVYWHWSTAVPRPTVHPSIHLGAVGLQ